MGQLAHQAALTALRRAHIEEFRIEFEKVKKQRGIVDTKDGNAYNKAAYQVSSNLKSKYCTEFEQYKKEAIESGVAVSAYYPTRKPRLKTIVIKTREDVDLVKLGKVISKVLQDFELKEK